jgi:aspartyl-tRNA(Asn)/glutamyl-tRNA(Gln) amidotransferase subunit A
MKPAAPEAARDVAALEEAIAATAPRLHGIASRSQGAQIAAEVLRLNDAVRAGAAGRIDFRSQPGDFPALLLARADSFGEDAA